MTYAKPFLGAQHRRQRLAHGGGPVKHIDRRITKVAIATGDIGFVKVFQQVRTAARQCFGQPQQRVQPCMISGAPFGRGEPFVDLAAAQTDIIGAEQRQRLGRRTIATRPPDFLVVGFDGFGQIGVGHPADIRLVDAHAKGHCRHHNQPVFLLETAFGGAAVVRLHPTMIMQCQVSVVAQRFGQPFGLGPRSAINDARLPPTP